MLSAQGAAPELVGAWLTKARAAEADLNYAATAPGLFKPEFVEQRQRDFDRAMQWARYWHAQEVRT